MLILVYDYKVREMYKQNYSRFQIVAQMVICAEVTRRAELRRRMTQLIKVHNFLLCCFYRTPYTIDKIHVGLR